MSQSIAGLSSSNHNQSWSTLIRQHPLSLEEEREYLKLAAVWLDCAWAIEHLPVDKVLNFLGQMDYQAEMLRILQGK
jgi:hypothetical protein